MSAMPENYRRPGWFTTNVFNRIVAWLTRIGVSVYGSRVLEVKGRKSGEWRQTPVNLLRYDGAEDLVAPRGHTQWVKNLRASGQGCVSAGAPSRSARSSSLTTKAPTAPRLLEEVEVRGRRPFPVLDSE